MAVTANTPVTITNVTCGAYHSILLGSNGISYSYGRNDYRQTGASGANGIYDAYQTVDINSVANGATSSAISAGPAGQHSLIATSGGLVSFGRNNYGQVGNGLVSEGHV